MAKNDKKSEGPSDDELALQQAQAEFDAIKGEAVASSGFPPYLKARVGALVDLTVLMLDASKAKFVRHVCMYHGAKDLLCATGPVKDQEEVFVKNGELFTVSDYKGLDWESLQGFRIFLFCSGRQALTPLSDGTPRNDMFVWTFKFHTPDDHARFNEAKKARMSAQANEHRRLLAEAASGLPITPSTGNTVAAGRPAGAPQQQLRG